MRPRLVMPHMAALVVLGTLCPAWAFHPAPGLAIASTPLRAQALPRPRGPRAAPLHVRMCGWHQAHEFVNAAAAIGTALPDTPLTTNLGVVSPVLLHQVLFLASNIGYFVAGAAVLRTRQSPKTVMGLALMVVGVASTFFHGSQILMPVGSPVTKLFCSVDSVLACSQFILFGLQCWQAVRWPSMRFLIGWPLAFFFYLSSGGCYTLTHALWHCMTAYLAYSIVEERDALVSFPSSYRPPLLLRPALLKRRARSLAAKGSGLLQSLAEISQKMRRAALLQS